MSTHLKANQAFRGTVFTIYLRICENFAEFSDFLKICNLIDYSLMTIKMIWIMDLIRWNWSWGHVELTWKEMVVSAHANLEKSKFLPLRFSLFRVSFCKKQVFFRLRWILFQIWLPWWLWNIDILKLHSICDRMVYNMSMLLENWSTQIFFTKKFQLSHRRVVVSWTLS